MNFVYIIPGAISIFLIYKIFQKMNEMLCIHYKEVPKEVLKDIKKEVSKEVPKYEDKYINEYNNLSENIVLTEDDFILEQLHLLDIKTKKDSYFLLSV